MCRDRLAFAEQSAFDSCWPGASHTSCDKGAIADLALMPANPLKKNALAGKIEPSPQPVRLVCVGRAQIM